MKNIEEILRELCYKAWHFARNAHRLYPDNKHTFSDYSSTEMKKDIDAATKAMEEYLQENTKEFLLYLDEEIEAANKDFLDEEDYSISTKAHGRLNAFREVKEKYLSLINK